MTTGRIAHVPLPLITMNLTLFIPDLFWPDTAQPEIYQGLPVAAIEKLLSKSAVRVTAPEEMDGWLCNRFNVARQSGSWPVAPLMLHSDAPVLAENDKEFWMRADPVHLRIEQNHLMLADSRMFNVTDEEAGQLVQDLNRGLANHGIVLQALRADRWYVRLPQAPAMQTYTLDQVTCRNINYFLPDGSDSMFWRKLLNEVQMQLHEHPVNQARESGGELSINSLWFWGGGYMPESVHTDDTHVWSNGGLAQALAGACRVTYGNLPLDVAVWLRAQETGEHLVVLDGLHAKAKYRDAYGWREMLREVEQNWFVPICEALADGAIGRLQVMTSNAHVNLNFTATRADLWKFWLMRKSMFVYAKKQ